MQKLERVTKYRAQLPDQYAAAMIGAFKDLIDEGQETYMNDLYTVNVLRGQPTGFGNGITMAHLSIKRNDKQARMDWRHMQEIKNQLVGPENEGVELFPAESRLLDTANQFHLWVFEDPQVRMPFGFQERLVTERSFGSVVQRPFETKPPDLALCEARMDRHLERLKNGTVHGGGN